MSPQFPTTVLLKDGESAVIQETCSHHELSFTVANGVLTVNKAGVPSMTWRTIAMGSQDGSARLRIEHRRGGDFDVLYDDGAGWRQLITLANPFMGEPDHVNVFLPASVDPLDGGVFRRGATQMNKAQRLHIALGQKDLALRITNHARELSSALGTLADSLVETDPELAVRLRYLGGNDALRFALADLDEVLATAPGVH